LFPMVPARVPLMPREEGAQLLNGKRHLSG